MPPPKSLTSFNVKDSAHDRRTELVKDMVAKESAAQDAKTVRLRALRMARDAAEPPAPPPAPKRGKKKAP